MRVPRLKRGDLIIESSATWSNSYLVTHVFDKDTVECVVVQSDMVQGRIGHSFVTSFSNLNSSSLRNIVFRKGKEIFIYEPGQR